MKIGLILFLLIGLGCEDGANQLDYRCIQSPKYLDKFELPEGLIGYNNYEDALDCSKKTNKPLAVYFSGYACVNCRYFEDDFLFTKEIKKKLNEDFIFVLLNVDDRRRLAPEDQVMVTFMNRERQLKTIGNLNSHFQTIRQYGGTQPSLAILDSNEKEIALMHYNKTEVLLKKLNEAIEKLD